MASNYEILTVDQIRDRLRAGQEVRLWSLSGLVSRVEDLGNGQTRIWYPGGTAPAGETYVVVDSTASLRAYL